MTELSASRVRELLNYDPATGSFTWRVSRRGSKNHPGDAAGTIKDRNSTHKYLLIFIDGTLHRAHRLAWLHFHGVLPKGGLDHINGKTLDNRIANLRECNQQQNNGNVHVLNRHNTSGYRGVTWKKDKRKWKAYINRNNRQCHLGYFDSKEAAYEAHCAAALKHFGEFARVAA